VFEKGDVTGVLALVLWDVQDSCGVQVAEPKSDGGRLPSKGSSAYVLSNELIVVCGPNAFFELMEEIRR